MNLTVSEITGDEPLTLAEAKRHCGITSLDSDVEERLTALITASREYAEGVTWRSLLLKTYELTLDCFPIGEIRLQRLPFKAVSSVTYIDLDGAEQTLVASEYQVDLSGGRIRPVDCWPDTKDTYNAVTITYTAGYDGTDPRLTLPGPIKSGMKLLVKHLYDNRDPVVISEGRTVDAKEVPMSVKSLLGMYSAAEVA